MRRSEFKAEGLGYRMALPDIDTSFHVDRLRVSSGEVKGHVMVRTNLAGARTYDNGLVHYSQENLSSSTARKSLGRLLEEKIPCEPKLDWFGMYDEFCTKVMLADRDGKPVEYAGELPPSAIAAHGLLVEPMVPIGVHSILFGDGGLGKALALDTPIATPSGWTTMRAIGVGDQVYDEAGNPTTVVAATDVMTGRPCYRVSFSDGSVIVADAQHQWASETRAFRYWPRQRKDKAKRRLTDRKDRYTVAGPSVVTTQHMAETLTVAGETNHAVRVADPIDAPEADLPVGPYTLGAWLGDGTSRSAQITSADPEIVIAIAAEGTPIRQLGTSSTRAERYTMSGPRGAKDSVQSRLRALGLLQNKHIPALYLRASSGQRLSLLQGLMDTDGTVSKDGAVSYTTTSPRLAEGIAELVCSLGMQVRVRERVARLNGRVISPKWDILFTPRMPVFRLARKAGRVTLASERSLRRFVVAVEPIESVPVKCIQVASESHLYLAGRSMIPTHNSIMAVAIAVSLQTGREIIPGFKPLVTGQTLYLNWETTREDIDARVKAVCAGAGIRPVSLAHITGGGRPLAQRVEHIARIIDSTGALMMIVDSNGKAIGTSGEGPIEDSANRFASALDELDRTALCIDHVSKAGASTQGGAGKPYGSTMKSNWARATWEMTQSRPPEDGDTHLVLHHRKHNTTAEHAPIGLLMHWDRGAVVWEEEDVSDATSGLSYGATLADQIAAALTEHPLRPFEIAKEAGISDNMVRAILSQNKRRFTKLPSGDWGLA